jgi:opacity protein-like surface antigen
VDLEGYYITAKGGVSKTLNTGTMDFVNSIPVLVVLENEDLGTGSAFGYSVGKYLNDNFRLELEATKRTGYEFFAFAKQPIEFIMVSQKADISSESILINGFYEFQPFTMSNTAITPYLGGGVGISKNKMGKAVQYRFGVPDGVTFPEEYTINQFAYKLSAGTLVSLTEYLSLDVNYQYVNLGKFKQSTKLYGLGARFPAFDNQTSLNDGEIKSQELMVGLQYTFLLL